MASGLHLRVEASWLPARPRAAAAAAAPQPSCSTGGAARPVCLGPRCPPSLLARRRTAPHAARRAEASLDGPVAIPEAVDDAGAVISAPGEGSDDDDSGEEGEPEGGAGDDAAGGESSVAAAFPDSLDDVSGPKFVWPVDLWELEAASEETGWHPINGPDPNGPWPPWDVDSKEVIPVRRLARGGRRVRGDGGGGGGQRGGSLARTGFVACAWSRRPSPAKAALFQSAL